MMLVSIIITITLLLLWSIYLPFYKEKKRELVRNEDKCFSDDNKSIEIKKNNRRAMLFIHGFPTTPFMYKWAADYASSKGYDVYAPLIPTFGSDWRDFVKTNFSSWYDYIDSYYKNLRCKYKEIYVVGVSMGGAMTLKLAQTNGDMDAIAVISAPVVYNSLLRDKIVTNPLGYIARIMKIFIRQIGAKPCTYIKGHNDGDQNWHGYKGVFIKQGVSLMYNLKAIRKELYKIEVPMIAIHERTDKTVPFKNMEILKNETNTKSEFHETTMGNGLKHTHHALLSYDSTKKPLMDKILAFFYNVHASE